MIDTAKIFISHSSKNVDIVHHFCTALTAIGIDVHNIFCSSIPGQGINGAQKLNDTIFDAINTCSLLVYFISFDFINSPYCIEELGVGWYRSQKGEAECYYLLIPDVTFVEINGFANSKIDKFTIIDDDYKADFGVLLENICEKLDLPQPKHSVFSNIEKVFFDSVRTAIEVSRATRREKSHAEAECEKSYRQKILSLESQIQKYEATIRQERELRKNDALRVEFRTIADRFRCLGYEDGISKSEYDSLYKEFWLSMAYRYIELDELFHAHNDNMEMLLACIFSHEGKLQEAYQHLIKYVSYSELGIYPRLFRNVEIDKMNDMHEIVAILEAKAQSERPGVTLDAYIKTINTLKERSELLKKEDEFHA